VPQKFSTLVFIGRFQPLHNEHVRVIEYAKTLAARVVVLVGSSGQARTPKNPFTFAERAHMIANSLSFSPVILPLFDVLYGKGGLTGDEIWANSVRENVSVFIDRSSKVGIIGHTKDESSFYLKMFVEWESVEVNLEQNVNATDIRDAWYHGLDQNFNNVPPYVNTFLANFKRTPDYKNLVDEDVFNKQRQYENNLQKYPPIFVTSDAVVTWGENVLLIKRKNIPGKGLLACPGGYVDANSDVSVEAAMRRELLEECGIDLSKIPHHIVGSHVFDAKARSARGRIITHAFHIELDQFSQPLAGDDAADAQWVGFSGLDRNTFFEDHYHILSHFLSLE